MFDAPAAGSQPGALEDTGFDIGAFQAAAEAASEAILNSMVCADSAAGLKGEMYYSLAEFMPLFMAGGV